MERKMAGWLKNACFYEIYPQSFKDTNGDGIGDFDGIIEKLDYICDLGCNAIWMNPCYDSPFKDAGYDVRDYKKAAARYGTNDDLARLFKEVHKRGMHILLDLVPGHTSEEHEWFIESSKPEPNEYWDRYIWTNDWLFGPEGLKGIAGTTDRNGVYVVNFFATQPALNYGVLNPDPKKEWQVGIESETSKKTVEAIKDVMRFWLDMGCDGFRVDMADSLVKFDDEQKSGTCAIWRNITEMLHNEYPEAAMVSEWNNPLLSIPAGFEMDFMLNWWGNGYDKLLRDCDSKEHMPVFRKNSKMSVCEFLKDYIDKYEAIKNIGKFCLITGNHDTERVSYFLDVSELKLAYAFLLTMPGSPFIYYGDEIGMRYQKELINKEGGYTRTGSRTPMQWDDSTNMGFSAASADKLYLPVDSRPAVCERGIDAEAKCQGKTGTPVNVKDQQEDPNSLLNTVKKLLSIRKAEQGLLDDANLQFVYAKENSRAFAYQRGDILIVCNPDEKEQSIDFTSNVGHGSKKLFEIGQAELSEGNGNTLKVCLKPQTFVIYKKQ